MFFQINHVTKYAQKMAFIASNSKLGTIDLFKLQQNCGGRSKCSTFLLILSTFYWSYWSYSQQLNVIHRITNQAKTSGLNALFAIGM